MAELCYYPPHEREASASHTKLFRRTPRAHSFAAHIARICSAAHHGPANESPAARYNLRLQGPPPTTTQRISDRAAETQAGSLELRPPPRVSRFAFREKLQTTSGPAERVKAVMALRTGRNHDIEDELLPATPSLRGRMVTVPCWFPAKPAKRHTPIRVANPPDVAARNTEAVQRAKPRYILAHWINYTLAAGTRPVSRPGFRAKQFGMGYHRFREVAGSGASVSTHRIANSWCVASATLSARTTLLNGAYVCGQPA
ncbi:hypothetical protein LXA43DRAFT_131008 [Ganoderma leucocontextum]|nr:hypothetical protein LXA43DRAFT_131008 [Ganoderma leucocontextum]